MHACKSLGSNALFKARNSRRRAPVSAALSSNRGSNTRFMRVAYLAFLSFSSRRIWQIYSKYYKYMINMNYLIFDGFGGFWTFPNVVHMTSNQNHSNSNSKYYFKLDSKINRTWGSKKMDFEFAFEFWFRLRLLKRIPPHYLINKCWMLYSVFIKTRILDPK